MSDIIKQLRKIRRDQELSQEAVEAVAALGDGHISQLERGKRTPNLITLTSWANALGYEVALQKKGEQ